MALIEHQQDPIRSVYDNNFDEYFHFPIIEKQFNFRLASIYRPHLLSDHTSSTECNQLTVKQNPNHIKLSKECTDYLLTNINQTHTLASIAKAIGTNRNSLAIAFKTVHGCGVFTWFKRKRLTMARDALFSSGASIQSVTYQFGFSDPGNFSRAYKAEFGISPSKAKNMLITVEDTKNELPM